MHSAADSRAREGLVPRLAPDWDPAGCSLSPQEGFLLSRIDGHTPWSELRKIGGLPPDQADQCLERWLSAGLVVVDADRKPDAEPAVARPRSGSAGGARGAGIEADLEPNVDLPEAFQRRVLELDRALDRPYHEILGVSLDADSRAIKRAYFTLSKEFHPDRYFRRQIGGFGVRLERIFKKVVEAYELLSDPSTRAELRRSMSHEPRQATGTPEQQAASRKREVLDRLRNHFKIPEKILTERRYKARQFFQSAMIAARKENWKEAAASVKLAIAFDPWNDEFKVGFANVQAEVHQLRAAELLEKANASWDDKSYVEALRLLEEVLHYRPSDAAVNHQAARAALELNELDKAREYAENACEAEPERADLQRTLGSVLRKSGLRDKAIAAFERVLELEPGDAQAQAELDSLRRGRRRMR